jgi:hypothetical protein
MAYDRGPYLAIKWSKIGVIEMLWDRRHKQAIIMQYDRGQYLTIIMVYERLSRHYNVLQSRPFFPL